jgi:hypothetical protein
MTSKPAAMGALAGLGLIEREVITAASRAGLQRLWRGMCHSAWPSAWCHDGHGPGRMSAWATPASSTMSRSAGPGRRPSRPARRPSSTGSTGGGWILRLVSGAAGLVNSTRRALSMPNSDRIA